MSAGLAFHASRPPQRAPSPPTALINGRIVLPGTIQSAAVTVADGVIVEISDGPRSGIAVYDLQGDYLLPGLVEIHTDNLERHLQPRPGVRWPPASAMAAHDLELAGSGITTALNAVSLGDTAPSGARSSLVADSLTALASLRTHGGRAEHFLHLRCELTDPRCADLFEEVCEAAGIRLVSLMDHTPGQRQWRSIERFREHYRAKHGLSAEELDQLMAERQKAQATVVPANRARVVTGAQRRGLPLASHDDADSSHVAEGVGDGVSISEFPTTRAAAEAARSAGLAVVMGAPNVLRGGSHAGNVSATELLAAGFVDILSSDFYPAALLGAVFRVAEAGWPLPAAVELASGRPAAALGLKDRGQIAPGLHADLVQVRMTPHGPVPVATWRQGDRIA